MLPVSPPADLTRRQQRVTSNTSSGSNAHNPPRPGGELSAGAEHLERSTFDRLSRTGSSAREICPFVDELTRGTRWVRNREARDTVVVVLKARWREVGNRGKQPIKIVLVNPLREERDDLEEMTGAESLKHRRRKRQLDRGCEAPPMVCLEHVCSMLISLLLTGPDRSPWM